MSTSFFVIYALLCFLFVLAIVLLALSKYQRLQSGLPEGEIVYEDVSGLAKEPLYSQRTSLSGKPDYLLKDLSGNLIPVEVKSSYSPKGDQPYESHLMQLAVYFFLIEDVLQSRTPYGLIRYRNRTVQVENDDELRRRLFDVIAQMRKLMARGDAHRTHDQVTRCARCSMAHACNERLI